MADIDVTPAQLDLTLYAGDGLKLRFVFTLSATGDPWEGADGDWEAQVRTAEADPDILVSFVIDDSDADDGIIIASLTGDDTRSILAAITGPVKNCYWDLQQTPTGEEPRTWYKGKVKSGQDVTR